MNEISQVAEIKISYSPNISNMPIIKSSQDAYEVIKGFFNEDLINLQEQFVVMYLNRSNRVLGVYKLSSGGLTGTVADIRLILGTALKAAACSIILCHNHPSGNLIPSQADVDISLKIRESAKLMEIKLLDHLIISPAGSYYSLAEYGHL